MLRYVTPYIYLILFQNRRLPPKYRRQPPVLSMLKWSVEMSSDCGKTYVTICHTLYLSHIISKPPFTAEIPPTTASIVPMLKWSVEISSDCGKTYV